MLLEQHTELGTTYNSDDLSLLLEQYTELGTNTHAHAITIVCRYPTLYTVLVAGRRHYQCVFVPNDLCLLLEQYTELGTNIYW
jgi:hypothetical protein